jgi:hypothetical protein
MPMIHHLLGYLRRHHVGLVALLLVLGGTAYAAASVGSRDVRDNSLRGIDVRANSLTGRDVAKGSIKAGDIAPSAIPTVTFSATVLRNGTGAQIVNPFGVTAVQRTGVGEYELTVPQGGPPCNVAASPISQLSNGGTATIALTEAAGNTITMTTMNAAGAPADLGPGLGYAGFSIVVNCPV